MMDENKELSPREKEQESVLTPETLEKIGEMSDFETKDEENTVPMSAEDEAKSAENGAETPWNAAEDGVETPWDTSGNEAEQREEGTAEDAEQRRRERRERQSRRNAPVQMARSSRSSHHPWNLGYFLREGFTNIFRHGLMSFAAVCTILACLLIMGTFCLVAVDLDANRQKLEAENEFIAYVDDALSQQEAEALGAKLEQVDNVKDTVFVDRLQVLAEFREEHQEDAELYALLPDDVFQHYYRIHVVEIDRLTETVAAVEKVSGVESVSAWPEVAEGMVSARNIAVGIAVVLVTMLALVSLFVIANTLRLSALYRRDEIAIMKMCGATNGFVRWPFVVEGALLGLFSAALAFFAQWWVYDLLTRTIVSSGQLSFLVLLPFAELWKMVLIGFCGSGLVIGMLGSLFAIRKFLQV